MGRANASASSPPRRTDLYLEKLILRPFGAISSALSIVPAHGAHTLNCLLMSRAGVEKGRAGLGKGRVPGRVGEGRVLVPSSMSPQLFG